jgi:signal transduction histidine kinase
MAARRVDDAGTGVVQDLLEAQRSALAREIHDDIGSALGAAHLDLAWVARHPDHAEAAAHVASAHEALRQAMAATQRLVWGLYPPDLSEDLMPALRALVRGFEQRHGRPVAFEVSSDFDALPAPARLAVYRTVQEALANVARHAPGSAVTLSSGRDVASMWLEVRDDGPGFEVGTAPESRAQEGGPGVGGFGLRGLAERARDAGGDLAVDSRSGRGTAVRLTMPAPPRGGAGDDDDNDNDGDAAAAGEAYGVDGRSG